MAGASKCSVDLPSIQITSVFGRVQFVINEALLWGRRLQETAENISGTRKIFSENLPSTEKYFKTPSALEEISWFEMPHFFAHTYFYNLRGCPPGEFILHQHAGRSNQLEPGTSDSVDSARSSVLVASYDGSGSSEGSVKRTRAKASSVESSGQSSLDCKFKHRSPKPAGQGGFSQTSSRSSGEMLGSRGISLDGPNDNQKTLRRHFSSRTLPLSEGM